MKTVRIKVGVLAIQGAFAEHIKLLKQSIQNLNATFEDKLLVLDVIEVRLVEQIDEDLDGLIIPGGETTVMNKHLSENGFLEKLKQWTRKSCKFTWGTCAGLILLSNQVEGGDVTLGGIKITCSRNSFGRQIDSFECKVDLTDPQLIKSKSSSQFHGVFIRAPGIKSIDDEAVSVLCRLPQQYRSTDMSDAVGVRQNNLMACTFHPELTSDTTWHEYFLKQVVICKTNQTL